MTGRLIFEHAPTRILARVPGRVVALRRYPVKSMGGESIEAAAHLDRRGLVGDRWFAVEDGDGHFASGKRTRRFRRHDEVFRYTATTASDGAVLVSDIHTQWRVGDRILDEELSEALGLPVRVTPELRVPHQDAGSVSLVGTATLRWCADHLGVDADPRRLRVNIVVESDEPFVEERWLGSRLVIGGAVLTCVGMTQRCRMIDVAQDGVQPLRRWLKPLGQQRGMNLGVYAGVMDPGSIRIGDTVSLDRRAVLA